MPERSKMGFKKQLQNRSPLATDFFRDLMRLRSTLKGNFAPTSEQNRPQNRMFFRSLLETLLESLLDQKNNALGPNNANRPPKDYPNPPTAPVHTPRPPPNLPLFILRKWMQLQSAFGMLSVIHQKSMPRGTPSWTSNLYRSLIDFGSQLGPSEPNLALAG